MIVHFSPLNAHKRGVKPQNSLNLGFINIVLALVVCTHRID